jgi:CDGSH-type Zn-finger protein
MDRRAAGSILRGEGSGGGLMVDEALSISVTENGPYQVTGPIPLAIQTIVTDDEGQSVEWRQGEALSTPEGYRLCRCGQSRTKPFCDGSHERVAFDGTETASREPYLAQAEEEDGPRLILTDAEALCAFARFCDFGGQVWNLVQQDDEASASLAIQEAERCPSGRLVAWDRRARGQHEPHLDPSIGVVEDPEQGVSGPLWVRGRIQVTAADGYPYEVRNRITLCRCGSSNNKPFCDGTHAMVGFDDGMIDGRT